MVIKDIHIGQQAEMTVVIASTAVDDFVRITGDNNVVHQGGGMVHGMLVASYISTMIGTVLPGQGAVWISHDIKFINPVYRGDELTIKAIVSSVLPTLSQIRMYVDVINQDGEVCVASTCWVKVQEK